MKLKITHTTRYSYDMPVLYGLQQLRLTPVTDRQQTVLNWDIAIEGGTRELSCTDQYNNHCTLIQAKDGATQIALTVSGEVETHSSDGIYGKVYGTAPLWHFKQSTNRTMAGSGIAKLSELITDSGGNLNELHSLSEKILAAAPYGKAVTDVTTTAEQALGLGGGVCQDHAQIFISAVRHAGIPARYVSGYLMMDDRIDQDASHAWAEAHIDGLGWVAFDVSNGISPDERYVRLAVGRDSIDAAPVSGMRMGNARETMSVSLQIQQ
ncbi:transglutaminase family protein [Sulfitobacter guttiformis]|uniref:Transglutaminase-like putative cysteine protease n=1 Tax=Sulfitobacter guttiformis TaxID=74349 RepID=A0A420DTC7_9RHOB|nr:transglutaminase family protein [Sulfitobacter guttiformis]KIN74860.1 Transglutaminase-like superfamily protein [Sulfitobacter guttiformis KCTC 32187]RKE97430.1 transglutaminase-like putative cysteine protease [Sulfitobacter guttiformis]